MIVLIDNYDSFSYNLYQLFGQACVGVTDIKVVRNDALDVAGLRALSPEALVLSPGPGRPEDSGVCPAAIRAFAGEIPIFGVCLGHQAICQVFGGEVSYAKRLMHGKQSQVRVIGENRLFAGMEPSFAAARYHSLSAVRPKLPSELRVTAESDDGEVMAVEHVSYPVFGVQFHPESVMTPMGLKMVTNFMEVVRHD